jgi:hypothetical protein
MTAPTSATITVQKIGPTASLADLVGALSAATSGGDAFLFTGKEFIVVSNTDSGSHTVTCSTTASSPAIPDNFGTTGTIHDLVQAVGAGKIAIIVPTVVLRFKDINNLLQLTYSAVTDVAVGVFTCALGA